MQKWMPEGKNMLQRNASWVCPGRGFSNLYKKGSMQASSRWRIFKAVQKWKQASKLQVEEFSKLCKNGSKQAGSRWRIFQKMCKNGSKQASFRQLCHCLYAMH
jgi:hypothetical protein